jgi:hypothetical protein
MITLRDLSKTTIDPSKIEMMNARPEKVLLADEQDKGLQDMWILEVQLQGRKLGDLATFLYRFSTDCDHDFNLIAKERGK